MILKIAFTGYILKNYYKYVNNNNVAKNDELKNYYVINLEDYETPMRVYNVGVLMASHLDSPFDLERCGPAVDLALTEVNEFLAFHNIQLQKVQGR